MKTNTKTSVVATIRRYATLIVGLSLLIADLSQSGANVVSAQSTQKQKIQGEYAEVHRPQEQMGRERAMDRIVHIEERIIYEIPQVPRICDCMTIEKRKIDIGGCNLYCEQEGEGIPLVLINGGRGGTLHCSLSH